jgi:hypothetical protein
MFAQLLIKVFCGVVVSVLGKKAGPGAQTKQDNEKT